MTRISALTALTSADGGDTLPILDVSATTTKKITKTALISDIVDGTLIAAQAITPTKLDLSVANDAARTALTGFEGLTVYQEDTNVFYVYDGAAWRRQAQWEELGRTTLGVAGDTISVTPIAARKYLRFLIKIVPSGNVAPTLIFNNDSGANYSCAYSVQSAAASALVTQPSLPLFDPAGASTYYSNTEIICNNVAAEQKLPIIQQTYSINTLASANPGMMTVAGKWVNTSAQITRVDIINVSSGNMDIGSEVVVLGHD